MNLVFQRLFRFCKFRLSEKDLLDEYESWTKATLGSGQCADLSNEEKEILSVMVLSGYKEKLKIVSLESSKKQQAKVIRSYILDEIERSVDTGFAGSGDFTEEEKSLVNLFESGEIDKEDQNKNLMIGGVSLYKMAVFQLIYRHYYNKEINDETLVSFYMSVCRLIKRFCFESARDETLGYISNNLDQFTKSGEITLNPDSYIVEAQRLKDNIREYLVECGPGDTMRADRDFSEMKEKINDYISSHNHKHYEDAQRLASEWEKHQQ